ncbi:hypothetical protein [Sphingomonas hankookensis]|uniref:hypothetical protein n=1 Tax=Sphingomonas hankookensis TaxID=563996 RepID=UPI003D30329F
MTDILDAIEAPLSRTPARFFFETGFFAAYAEASIKAGNRPPFDLTDAIVERAWEIAPDAHPDRAEFDRYLSSADSADAQLAEAEATYRAFDEANREADGSREGLRQSATALRRYGAELFPANRAGAVHFARVLMDSVASVIDAALAAQLAQGRPVTESCGIVMVEVTDGDRAEFERGLITHGFAADTAKELAREQPANDGALQMLARHRLATLASAPAGGGVETARAVMAERMRAIQREEPHSGFDRMAEDLLHGRLMHVQTWLALDLLAAALARPRATVGSPSLLKAWRTRIAVAQKSSGTPTARTFTCT